MFDFKTEISLLGDRQPFELMAIQREARQAVKDADHSVNLGQETITRVRHLYENVMAPDITGALESVEYIACKRGLFIAATLDKDGKLREGPYSNYPPGGLFDVCQGEWGCTRGFSDNRGEHYDDCAAIHAAEQIKFAKPDDIWIESGVRFGITNADNGYAEEFELGYGVESGDKWGIYPCIRCLVHCRSKGITRGVFISQNTFRVFDVEAHASYLIMKYAIQNILRG